MRKQWIEELIYGSPQDKEPTYINFSKAFNDWSPKNDIPFDTLVKAICHCKIHYNLIDEDWIIGNYEELFNKIELGSERKQAVILFLDSIQNYQFSKKIYLGNKNHRYQDSYKNHRQKVSANINSAQKVYQSLIKEGLSEETKTAQLISLLHEYIEQNEKMLKSGKLITTPLEIKNYNPIVPTKEPIKKCLQNIIKEYSIKINKQDSIQPVSNL